jgi:hypothetical protein
MEFIASISALNANVRYRVYFMQQWYALSDPSMEDALYEIESMTLPLTFASHSGVHILT